jgi:hypothetical protein
MKYSEYIHKNFQLGNFRLTGDPVKDADRFVEYMKISSLEKEHDVLKKTAIFRFSFGELFTVYSLTDGAIGKVKRAKIENMPKEIPRFMQHSFLIETRHDDKTFFDNIRSIGGLLINNEVYLIFETNDEKLYSQTFSNIFDGKKIEDINLMYTYDANKDPSDTVYMKERKDVLSFVLALSLFLEAERTPLLVEVINNKKPNGNKSKRKEKPDWIEKRIYIDKTIKYKKKGDGSAVFDKEGKRLKDISVHGFLRLQHFGKGLSESKWIYIEDYDSTRWVNSGDTRITVDIYDKHQK